MLLADVEPVQVSVSLSGRLKVQGPTWLFPPAFDFDDSNYRAHYQKIMFHIMTRSS